MDLKEVSLTLKYVDEVIFRREKGEEQAAAYYHELALENAIGIDETTGAYIPDPHLEKTSDRIFNCARNWFFDHYGESKTRDLKSIYLCHNKFCPNCQKLMAEARYAKFIPEILRIGNDYQLYHLTLTVPNCSALFLNNTIDKLFKKFPYLVRYLKCDAKIKGLDFSRYGYAGAIRAFEITYDEKLRFALKEYHPHIHIIVALEKNLQLDKSIVHDKFSWKYDPISKTSRLDRKFSKFEILLQKLWYFLNNQKKGERITLKRINELPDDEGYTCTLDPIDDDAYMDVFKYATKPTNGHNKDDEGKPMRYVQFKTLRAALDNRRQIQGYGIFRGLDFENDLKMIANAIYDDIVNELRKKEKPTEIAMNIYDIRDALTKKRKKPMQYISRFQNYNLLRAEYENTKEDKTSQERLAEALKRLQLDKKVKYLEKTRLNRIRAEEQSRITKEKMNHALKVKSDSMQTACNYDHMFTFDLPPSQAQLDAIDIDIF